MSNAGEMESTLNDGRDLDGREGGMHMVQDDCEEAALSYCQLSMDSMFLH